MPRVQRQFDARYSTSIFIAMLDGGWTELQTKPRPHGTDGTTEQLQMGAPTCSTGPFRAEPGGLATRVTTTCLRTHHSKLASGAQDEGEKHHGSSAPDDGQDDPSLGFPVSLELGR